MGRPSWDKTRMDMVRTMAKRSVCLHYQVGAVFYRNKKLLTFGYNGPPKGEPHCLEVGCAKEINGQKLPAGSGLCRGGHAERNAIINAAYEGISLKGAGICCTYSPCYDCAKDLVNLGITEFVYEKEYIEELPKVKQLFNRRGITLRKFDE